MSWTIAYYAFFVAPAILWFVNQFIFKNGFQWLLLFVLATMTCYGLLLLSVRLLDSHLEAELYKHDLNGDRAFSGAENTAAMRNAMERLTNDTGRALAPVTGVPISLIWVTLNYIPLGLVSLAIWRFRSHRGDFDPADDRDDLVDPGINPEATCENPYSPPRTKR